MILELNTETDFTLSSLKDYLNETYKKKVTGVKFTNQDIQAYCRRGMIPPMYGGGCKIEVIESKEIGIKIFRIPGLRK